MKEIRVKDWVKVKKTGITEPYQVEKIENGKYIVVYKEGSYEHRLELNHNEIERL